MGFGLRARRELLHRATTLRPIDIPRVGPVPRGEFAAVDRPRLRGDIE
jgi:hypothetical protein